MEKISEVIVLIEYGNPDLRTRNLSVKGYRPGEKKTDKRVVVYI